MITGIGSINRELCGDERSRAVVMAYDATVLAGTQGIRNHAKTDRMLGIALQNRLPVVLFAEGGGGRPGNMDLPIVAGLHVTTFASYARLSGQVPVIGIAAGRCFAGNAALLGCSDVIIAGCSSAAHLRVPLFSIVLRKGYGLGAMAMTGGGFHAPAFTAAWPSGEFGAMGGRRGAARLPQGTRGRSRGTAARRAVLAARRRALREGQGDQHGRNARNRHRHVAPIRPAAGSIRGERGAQSSSRTLTASGQWRACSAGSAAS